MKPEAKLGLMVFGVAAIVFVLVGVGIAVVIGSGTATATTETSRKQETVGKKPKAIEQEEFEKLVHKKTREEVLQILGKPDRIKYDPNYKENNSERWYYFRRTYNKKTNKIDKSVNFTFSYEDFREDKWFPVTSLFIYEEDIPSENLKPRE